MSDLKQITVQEVEKNSCEDYSGREDRSDDALVHLGKGSVLECQENWKEGAKLAYASQERS